MRHVINQLNKLSDADLIASADKAIAQERKCKVWVIMHLAEIYRRSVHLDWGYRSLWEYCENRLMLSPGSISNRTHVAKACVRHPELLTMLVDGRLSLATARMIVPKLNHPKRDEMLALLRWA